MATYRVTAPDGGTYRIEGPDDATDSQVAQAVLAKFPDSNKPPAPPDESKSGFIPALQAGFKGLKSDAAALAAKTGLMDVGAAENYIAKQREESAKIFQPTQDEWTESPWKKLKELAGGSAAYMAAPVVAGAATLALPATLAPAVATGIGMGLTGLVSGAQFTGSNLTRQMGEGSSLADTELGSAALAAIPQAALDVLSLKMIPGVRGIFGAAGKKMTVEEAEAIATQGLKRTVADYALSTGKTMGVEGLTEAGQQVFERLQAGLSLTDEKAQKEYLDSFLGGAALGGAMAPVGRYFERGREQRQAEVVGAMPGQRPGESLADAAQRLKNEIDAEKLNLLPPPAPPPPPVSPILSEQDLNNLPYGQIPAYIGTLQALPQTPEIRAAIKAANTASLNDTEGVVNDFLLKKLDEASRSLQPQAEGAGDLSFLPADLSTVISAQLANSIGFVQNKSKTNIFDQIVGKDISDPDQAAAVIDILNKYKAGVKPGATSQNIDTFIESIPFFKPPATQGTVNVGTTDTAPGGESTVLASEPGAGSTTPGVAATQPDGMVSTGQDVTSTVGGEAAAPPSVEKPVSFVGPEGTAAERQPSMLKEREAFGKAIGAVRGAGGWNLSGRVNQPAAKAVMLEDTPGVLSALSKSKNVFTQKIAELANLIPGLKTRINPEASEEEDLYRQNSEESTIVSHTMHINQLDAMRELKPIVEQLPSDQSYISYKLLSKYVLLPKNTISDGNIEVNLNAGVRNINIKKSFLDTLEKLEAETKELGETRMRQSIGRVPYKRTAVAGSFDRSTNTVEIQSPYFAKDENILTHEYTHAITSYAIDNPTEEQKPIVRKLQKLFEHVKENLGKVREEVNPLHNKQYANANKPYGLTNIHEFVSEAWGNPDFQYWLSKVPYEKTTAWSKFVETIAQLLGIKDSNALTEAIALSEELVTAAKTGTEAQEKEYFSKRKPKEPAKAPAELSEVEKQDLAAIEAFKAEGPARIAEKTEQFKNILSKMLTRMGLKDVAVKIMDDIESKTKGAEGSYSARLIKIALDVDKPVRTLRHEAIHALKELGFFSESQWNTLVKQAKEGWIDTYLKNLDVNGEPLKEGEKSRYDIYMERPEFKSDPNAIIEEAIADAFGDFDTNGAPPGMLKAILNRLISFFDAIKSALQGNGIYTSEQAARQIFGKITRGELKAETESNVADSPDIKFSIRTKPDPKNTITAYKLFRMKESQPGKLFPLFIGKNEGVPMNTWVDADNISTSGFADRPGWHAGDKPIATHIGEKVNPTDKASAPGIRPSNQVWAEIEMPNDVDWQTEANKRGTNVEGKRISVKAHITDQVPVDGVYRYKTNPNMIGSWLIGGAIKINRLLSDSEVLAINKKAGVEDLPRKTPLDLSAYGFEKLSLRKPFEREGSITSGAQSGVQSGTQQGEASEQARSGEPALRPGDRGGEGSDGRDEEKLSIRKAGDSGGVGRGREAVVSAAPLQGAPSVPSVNGPDPRIVEVAERYAREHGIDLKRQSEYVEVSWPRGKRLADAYEAMQHNPQDPAVKAAYKDLIKQTTAQYLALEKAGYKFWFIDFAIPSNEAYINTPWNSIRDLRNNKEMGVFPTTSGFGSSDLDVADNPLLVDTGIKWPNGGVDGELKNVLANDLFRAVHDAFGHGIEGAGFRWDGEENAWQAHARLYTGPALHALTSETRGQNSQVNFGKDGEFNRTASGADTIFADQKVGLMPDWTWKEGMSKDEPVFQELDSRKDAKMFRNAVDRVKRGREYAFPLHVHDLETYQDARLFLSEDKESGFALIGDEIGSFFSGGGGQAYPTLRLAVEEGGRRIDAYRTKLPSVLGKAQFRPVARVEFNPEMATELWDFEKFKQFQNGNPDLVFYAYDPSFNPKGDLKAGDEAVAKTPLVEYEQAVELQVAAAKYSLRGITLGTKQQDSVASSGVHYGKAKTDTLDALKYGTGLRGAESRRLETHWDNRIKKRVYFYIAKPDGTMPLPESGLGGYVYTQTFDNLAPPSVVSRLYSEARGDANTMESLIVDAGYDGYAVPKMGMMVVLNHNTPVEYQGTKAEYESKKQEKLSLRSIPLSTRGIMEANDAFARSELGLKTKAVRNRFNKVRDIAIALNRETLENQGQMNRKELTTDDLNTISRALADEVSYQLLSSSKTGTGLGWYSNNYPKAVKRLAKRFPELESNQHARAVFSALVAVTSNGEKVTKNISNAITLYAKLRDGKPLVAMSNRRATALVNNLKQIEMLLVKYDTDFEKELKKEVTVADMNAYLRSVGKKADASYLANTRIPAAAIYFGPKLGAFYANLSGSEGYLTMDLWWTRTFNRMRGLLIPHATDASIDKFREMIGKPNATRDDILAEAVPLRDKYKEYSFNTELEHLVGKKEPDTKAGKIDWVKRARVVAEDAFDQLMYDNRLEKMANTIYKNEYEMLQEAPFSSSDRKFMYDAARRTQKMLQGEGIDLSLADIQAALWYYEKRLYGKLSGKKADDIGYEEAIIKQSSEGRGRTRLSVVFDRGVDTGNVAAGESGTPDESGGVPAGSTEKLSLRSTWRASANAAIDRTSVARIEEGWASRILNAISPKHFSEYRQVWLNRYNQLGVYDKQRADRMGGFGLLADASSEAAAMMSDYGAGLTAAVFSKAGGVPVFANGMTTISTLNGTVKGPLEIFSVLTKLGKGDPDIYRAYQLWAGVKRGKRFMPSTTNPNGTEENYLPSDIAEAAYYEKLYPEFVDVQKEWIKYNNQLSKYLVDTGVISAEGRKEWIKYADYIPFYRQVDDEQTVGPKLFQSLTGVKPPKKLKGGTDLPIADFLETIIRNTQSAIQMGIKNTAGQKAVTVALSLNTPGSTDVLEPLAYTSTTDDSITILVNGMKRSFRSQDKLWLQAVTSLNLPDVPFMGLFSKPAQLLRTLVTKEPGFMLANMIRDSMSSHVTSGIGSVNPATTIRNFAAAIAGKSPEFQALFNAGILGGHEYSKDIIQSGNKFASDLRKTSGFRTANEKLASPITGIWEALEKGTTASDAATRMQVYREVLAKTNNEAEAIYRAVEVMNFNRKGNSAIVRVLTAAIPFLNARMQGLDVFYRAAFGKGINQQSADAIQKQFFIRGATMMAMSCMYWALTHDDDEYKKQEQETKDNYWLLPSLGIKLPIPFEVGILFKVIPERIMALTFGTDTNKDFTESMVRQLSNTLSLNPIPQVAKPFIEYNTNYNFFTGRPIVGSGMEGVESGYQTGPNTSGIAVDIGKATGMSPLKLDHLVGGFTGTMGMYAFSLMDSIYKINGDSTDASKRFEQSPVIKRFLIDPEARGTVSAYYEIKNSTDAAVRTAGLLERTMNYKEWGPYYKDNIKLLATHDYMLSLEKSMKDFREMKLMIRSSKLSPDEKRDALLNITKAENKLTSNIQVIKKNID